MQDDESISIAEFESTRESIRTTFGGKSGNTKITTTRSATLQLMENHHVNFDLLSQSYSSNILSWAGKKGTLSRRLVMRGDRIEPVEFKRTLSNQKDMVIIITTTDGDIFGCYESRKIPQMPLRGQVYSKGKTGKHFVFSLSGPTETAFSATRKKRKGFFNDKPFIGMFSNETLQDMLIEIKNFCLIANNGGGMLYSTYEDMYEYDKLGKLKDYTNENTFRVSCIGVYQIV